VANLPSLSPTGIKVYPIPGIGVEVHATFHQTNALSATYAQFQVSIHSNFSDTIYDSGQVAITPIVDGAEGIMVFDFVPSSANTYYYRLCFWDNSNYTHTTWLVWNGTTVGASTQTAYLYPSSDGSCSIETVYPASPTTHYDKVDEITHNDTTDYVQIFKQTGQPTKEQADYYNLTDFSDANFKLINYVKTAGCGYLDPGQGDISTVWAYMYLVTHGVEYFKGYVGYGSLSWVYALGSPVNTNPNTGLAWTIAELNALVLKLDLYIAGANTDITLKVTQVNIQVNYDIYTFPFTAPGDNLLVIGFPTITSMVVSNSKDKYAFTAVINDTYNKVPVVSLNVNNETVIMDCLGRTGTGPYVYTYSKILSLERGDFAYYINIGNVWTTVVADAQFMHADYNLGLAPQIEIFIGNRKIKAWNPVISESILPDYPEIDFDTDEYIGEFDITVRFIKNDIKTYVMALQGISKIDGGYRVHAREDAENDLSQVVSLGLQAMNSLNLFKSILSGYVFFGNLAETVYFQSFVNDTIASIASRILILNHSIALTRNKKMYIYDMNNVNSLFRLSKNDAHVDFSSNPSSIINKVWEYYIRTMYPVPNVALTNYDAANWVGTVSDVRQTTNGILPPSKAVYCLKGNGTIARTVNFSWTDFDQFHLNWSPDAATQLEIRLETDTNNYRKYIRTFAGKQGAGFVLTSSNLTDIVTKTISFAAKYISMITGTVSQSCSYKIELKLSGVSVFLTDWVSTYGDNQFGYGINNIQCDEILLSFKNLYPVGTAYGIECLNLHLEEYAQTYHVTSTEVRANWHSDFSGGGGTLVYSPIGPTWNYTLEDHCGAAPSCDVQNGESMSYGGSAYLAVWLVHTNVDGTKTEIPLRIGAGCSIGPNSNNEIIVNCDASYTQDDPNDMVIVGGIIYKCWATRFITASIGEWVWVYGDYDWLTSYNLWDSLAVPYSQFQVVGTPTDTINTIRFVVTGDNYYDALNMTQSTPIAHYVEAINTESIKQGVRFQERKTDGWSSKESASAFAKAFVALYGIAVNSYSKQMPMNTDISIGDMVDCDDVLLPVYKISYDLKAGQMIVFIGRSTTSTLEFMKETSRKIEAVEKTLY
jgi:hypothetical protein